MKKLLLTLALLWALATPTYAEWIVADCDTIPSGDKVTGDICSQTSAGSRAVGLYYWTGAAWVTAGGGHIIEDEGTPQTQRSELNFTGAGVTVTDTAGKTKVDIPAGGAPAFNTITGGTNAGAAMVVGTGASLGVSGTGTITPNYTPSGTIAATTVQGAISELDSETQTSLAGRQPLDADLTALSNNATAGFWAAATNVVRSMATASANNITITNPAGVAGNPTFDVGPNVFLTTRSHTQTAGDVDFSAAASFKFPTATGAAPNSEGRCAQDSTAHRLKCNFGSGVVTLAVLSEVQPLNTNLTSLSALTGANNQTPVFTGPGTITLFTWPSCPDSGGNHINFDATSHLPTCGTSSTGGLSGLTTNKFLMATGTTTADTSGNLSQSGGVVNASSGFSVGAGPYLLFNTSAIAASDKTWTVLNQDGTIRPSTGVLTAGHILTTDANGLLVDGGVVGTGTWTDSSSSTGSNKTLDDSTSTLKLTKSVQAELYGPITDTATCTGCYYFRVPVSLNGTNLVGVQSNTITAGTTGLTSAQITKCAAVATSPTCSGTTVSMLSTVLSIDSGETSSSTAATAAVISATAGVKAVATGDILRFDVTEIQSGTAAKGLIVNLDFKLP